MTNKTGTLVMGMFLWSVAVVVAVAAVPSYAVGGASSTPSARPEFSVTLGNTTYHGAQASNVGVAIMAVTPMLTNSPPFVGLVVVVQNDQHDAVTLDVRSFELVDSNGKVHPEMDDPSVNARAFDAQLKPGATQTGSVFFLVSYNFKMNGSMLRFRGGMRGDSIDLPLKVNSSVKPRTVKNAVIPSRPDRDDGNSDEYQYRPSDQQFIPFELSQNPYRFRGQSGILDTSTIYMVPAYGPPTKGPRWPDGGLRFERMIDEHTAIYQIMTIQYELTPDGEIAVLLPDSDPPDPKRPWRVLLEGVLEGTNAMGATVQVPAVRFEGYDEEPAQ